MIILYLRYYSYKTKEGDKPKPTKPAVDPTPEPYLRPSTEEAAIAAEAAMGEELG